MGDIEEVEGIPVLLDKAYNIRLQYRDIVRLRLAIQHLKAMAPKDDPIRAAEDNPIVLLDRLVERREGDDGQMRILPRDEWALRALLWAALRREDASITLDRTADLIDDFMRTRKGTLGDLAFAVWMAWHVGFVDQETSAPKGDAGAEAQTA